MPGNTSNPIGSRVTLVTVGQLPGLNTLDISMPRIDYAPMGCYSTPHILVTLRYSVLQGSNPDNRLITKDLRKGDVLVFPVGLPHFQWNMTGEKAVSLSALSSQNPGVITIANAVFGSNPATADDVLAKPFQVDKTIIDHLQAQF